MRSRLRPLVVRFRHRGLSASDVFLASYPRSGNTWAKFLLAGLVSGQDVSFASSEEVVPMVGRHRRTPSVLPGDGRLIKTHEPYRDEYRRAVYLVRDFRDVVLSYHRQYQGEGMEGLELSDFIAEVVAGRVPYGRWDEHVGSWLQARRAGHDVKVVRYEDLVARTPELLREIATFLGVQVSEEDIRSVIEKNTISRMKQKAEASEDFARKVGWTGGASAVGSGSVGGWREQLGSRELEALGPMKATLAALGYE